MPKLKLPDIEKVVAIDIHTHAEEPCGLHADDGYDDFQERMAEYFLSEVGREISNQRVQVYKVRIWETDTCAASYEIN